MMTWYLQLNLAIGAFGLFALFVCKFKLSSRQKLKIHSTLIILSLLVLPMMQLVPQKSYQYPQREILQLPMNLANQSSKVLQESITSSPILPKYSLEYFFHVTFIITFWIIGLLIWNTFRTINKIHKMFLFKKVGQCKILISDHPVSPYSFSLFLKSYVVLPKFLLKNTEQFNLALKHELQHLRNRDTSWVYIIELMNSACFLNPIIYLWKKQFFLVQEFACDEVLIAQRKISPRAYANCLMQVAEATRPCKVPFGAMGMTWGKSKPQLLRRIVRMKFIKKETKTLFNIIVTCGVIFFAVSVFALHAPVNSLTLSDLSRIANPTDFNEFPIEINDQVLKELNRFLSNSKWRDFARESLQRYENYKDLIDKKANQYHLPTEIAAVAFVETGFKNLPDRSTSISSKGAGMWQFIPGTARQFGLKVDNRTDERLDIPKATDAALRYLASNKYKLQDLRLALMGYYVGEGRVQQDIDKFGTSNPWLLIEQGGYKTPYLARVMAAAILLKYQSLLE